MHEQSTPPSETPSPSLTQTSKRWHGLVVSFQWLLLFIFARSERITINEIKKGRFAPEKDDVIATLEGKNCEDDVLDLAKELYEEEESRLASVQEKTRALIAICAITVPLVVAFTPRLKYSSIGLIPLLFLLCSILLLLMGIRLLVRAKPSIDSSLLEKTEKKLKADIASRYLAASNNNTCVTNYIATIYGAAYRAFAFGITSVVLIVALLPWIEKPLAQPAPPTVPITVLPATLPPPVIHVDVQPATQPAPTIQVSAIPSTQPTPTVNINLSISPTSTQPTSFPTFLHSNP